MTEEIIVKHMHGNFTIKNVETVYKILHTKVLKSLLNRFNKTVILIHTKY
ncbi:MAG: hypothetical protein R2837_07855 [Aliarcobacter sp.]